MGMSRGRGEGEFQIPLQLQHIHLPQVCCPQYLGSFNNSLTLTEEAVYAVDRWVKTILGSGQVDKNDIKVSGYVGKDDMKTSGQVCKDDMKASGQVGKDDIKASGHVGKDDIKASRQVATPIHFFYRHNLSYHDLLSTACNIFQRIGRFFHRVAMSVYLCICPLFMQFFFCVE